MRMLKAFSMVNLKGNAQLFMTLCIIVCAVSLINAAMAQRQEAIVLPPAVFIGTQSVWNNGSVQVVMQDEEGRAILMTLRGQSNSEIPESLSIILYGKPLPFNSNESIMIQKGLRRIMENTDPNNWKYKKIALLLGFLENNKKYDGIDAQKLLADQPFQEVFGEILNRKIDTKPK